jgi:tetratricopeptide (TPR) repeat protein
LFGSYAFGYQDPLTDYHTMVRRIQRLWPVDDEPPSDELMHLIEEAVEKCPHMPDLWLQRAELIQRCELGGPYELEDARLSLEAAARIDPNAIEVYEAFAAFCEDTLGDLERAEREYVRCIQLNGGPWVYTGLARVLAAQDRFEEAQAALEAPFCPYHDEPQVREARARLADGVTEF